MRNVTITRIGAALAMAAALTGCQTLRESAGLTKASPDEFAVTTKAPLVIPPGFNLRPPSPGAAPTNQEAADATVLFGGDTATIASNIVGSYTPGERMLLAATGVNRADPGIRQRLQSDTGAMQGADAGFTARLLGTRADTGTGAINADAEFERRRGAARTAPAPASRTSSGGWFDWF